MKKKNKLLTITQNLLGWVALFFWVYNVVEMWMEKTN